MGRFGRNAARLVCQKTSRAANRFPRSAGVNCTSYGHKCRSFVNILSIVAVDMCISRARRLNDFPGIYNNRIAQQLLCSGHLEDVQEAFGVLYRTMFFECFNQPTNSWSVR